jgi:spore coat protein CotH
MRLGSGAIAMGLLMIFPAIGMGCSKVMVEGKDEEEDDSPFHPDRVVTVYIYMTNEDWEYLKTNAIEEQYVKADLWYDGELIEDIAVRPKGNSSLSSVISSGTCRFSLKADINFFNAARNLHGVKKLNFNNGWSDPTYIREVLGYELFEQMALPTPRASFVDLWVNDTHLGLYTMVEHIDKTFLGNHFADNTGNLYKPETPAAYLNWTEEDVGDQQETQLDEADVNLGGGKLKEILQALEPKETSGEANSQQNKREVMGGMNLMGTGNLLEQMGLKTNENNPNHSHLFRLLDILNNEPDETFPFEIEKILDVDNVLRFLAVSVLIVHLDNYIGLGHNYYLYDNDGKFVIIPWDLNMAFGTFNSGLSSDQIINFYIDEPTAGAVADRPLVDRLLSYQPYMDKYHAYLEELLDGAFNVDRMHSRIDELADLIRPYVEADELKFYTTEQFEKGLEESTVQSGRSMFGGMGSPIGLKPFIEQRSQSVREQLDGTRASGSGNGSGNGGSGSFGGMGGWQIPNNDITQGLPDDLPDGFSPDDLPDDFVMPDRAGEQVPEESE